MIAIVVSQEKKFRTSRINDIILSFPESEVVLYDDTYGSISDLEQYLFPSLFTPAAPILHVKFMLSDSNDEFSSLLIKKMLASPTLFLFEDMMVAKSLLTTFKKAGAIVHSDEVVATAKKTGDIFAVTKALTAADKKSRWMAYRAALEENPIEGVIGILYWKVRDLIAKEKDKNKYKKLYKALLSAHVRAWTTGAPLDVLIEKVILTH